MNKRKEQRQYFKRFVAAVLAVCMVGTCCDWTAVAKAAGLEQNTTPVVKNEESAYVYEEPENIQKTEIPEERTENSTTWQLSDGNK